MPAREPWSAAVRRVGDALVALLRAELDELGRDLRTSRKKLGRVAVLGTVATFLSFWLLAVLLYAAIEVVSLWLPRWGAALAVAGLVLLVIAGLTSVLVAIARTLDSPVRTVQRRVENHLLWWNETLGPGPGDGSAGRLTVDEPTEDEESAG